MKKLTIVQLVLMSIFVIISVICLLILIKSNIGIAIIIMSLANFFLIGTTVIIELIKNKKIGYKDVKMVQKK